MAVVLFVVTDGFDTANTAWSPTSQRRGVATQQTTDEVQRDASILTAMLLT